MDGAERRRREVRLLSRLPLLGIGLLLGGMSAQAGAQVAAPVSAYDAAAQADGVRVIVAVPDFVAVERLVDAGATTAQAALSSVAGPSAFAAHPYPGDVVVALPGLAKIFGFPADLPPYPFFVSASATAPDRQVDHTLLALEAHAHTDQATARARSGADGETRIVATAGSASAQRAADGAITALAEASTEMFQAGPLQINGIRSRAKAAKAPASGGPVLESALEVGSVTVGDVAVAVTPDGLRLAGVSAPLPRDNPLDTTLRQAGLSVEYLRGSASGDTVVSPGLRVRVAQVVPGVDRKVDVTFLLGQTAARAGGSAAAGSEGLLPMPAPVPSEDGLPGPAVAAPSSGSMAPSTEAPTTPAGPPALWPPDDAFSHTAPPETQSDPDASASAAAPPASTVVPTRHTAGGRGPLATASADGLYASVAAGGLLVFLALHGLRQFGVRRAWTARTGWERP